MALIKYLLKTNVNSDKNSDSYQELAMTLVCEIFSIVVKEEWSKYFCAPYIIQIQCQLYILDKLFSNPLNLRYVNEMEWKCLNITMKFYY